jgi:hypothetical protein
MLPKGTTKGLFRLWDNYLGDYRGVYLVFGILKGYLGGYIEPTCGAS